MSRRKLDHSDPAVLTEHVRACVAEAARQFSVTPEDVLGRRRTKLVAAARAMAMALVRRRCRLSLPDIGRRFGRDHTTVLYAIRKAEREMPERLAWKPPPDPPTDELTLEQWEDRMGWSREAAAE